MWSPARYRPWLAAVSIAFATSGCVLDRSGTAACIVDSDCPPGGRCLDGRCVPSASDAGPPDAGPPDAGPERDAGFDAGTDAGIDAGTDAGAPFDPRAIPGLVLWLRADTLGEGPLSEWNDEGPEAHIAAVVGTPPVVALENGVPVVQFDGTGHLVTDPIRWGEGATIFLVARVDAEPAETIRLLHSDDRSSHLAIERRVGGSLRIVVANTLIGASPPPDAGFHLFEVFEDARVDLRIDDAVVATADRAIPRRLAALGIGGNPVSSLASSRLVGAIAEILVWDEPLSDVDRARVAEELRTRWAPLL